jgi:hypothetical protein
VKERVPAGRRLAITLVLASVAGLVGARPAIGQEVPVPAELQARLFAKVLSFDRNLPARAGADVVVGVLVQRQYRASLDEANEIVAAVEALRPAPASQIRLHAVLVEADQGELDARLDALGVEVLYVTPLRALGIDTVLRVTRPRAIRTLTGVPSYVGAGIAVGIGVKDDRPEILVNLAAARLEGADYSSQLLNLARLVR